jgi:hypothetical protein
MIIGSRQRLLVHDNENIRIEIDGKTIKRVNETKSFGLQIDEHLKAMLHGAIFLATCNAILLLRDVN